MNTTTPTRETATRILDLLSHGLTSGLGSPEPGKMCVEAAVCYAMGLPHSDEPPCVALAVRAFKISLNEAKWSSNTARAQGLKRLAIAQLGSESIDQRLFVEKVTLGCIQKIVPVALRNAAKLHNEEVYKEELEQAAKRCEVVTTLEAAARAARAAVYTAYNARATADNAVRAADNAVRAADNAYNAVRTADNAAFTAFTAFDVARAAANAADNADNADEVLNTMAAIGVEALKECNSPGCEWLDLCD